MTKKSLLDYALKVRIINGFIVVTSDEFDYRVSAGSLKRGLGHVEANSYSIGSAVLKVLLEVQKRIDASVPEITYRPCIKKQSAIVSIGYAANYLNTSVSTIRRMIKKNELLSTRTSGGHRRIHFSSLEKAKTKLNPT